MLSAFSASITARSVALLLSPATAGLLAAAGLLVDFYILVRTPYTVGDRIQIGDATGDAIDVSYLDTTLWEFGGPYLSTDHPKCSARPPVDELDVREHPSVIFRLDDNTFVDAIVRYLVHPKEAGLVKNRLVNKLLTAVNAHRERVRFPKGDTR